MQEAPRQKKRRKRRRKKKKLTWEAVSTCSVAETLVVAVITKRGDVLCQYYLVFYDRQ
jgi:hypothetical protein